MAKTCRFACKIKPSQSHKDLSVELHKVVDSFLFLTYATSIMANDDREYFKVHHEKILGMLAERRAERDELQAEVEQLNQEIVQLEQLDTAVASFVMGAKPEPSAVLLATDIEGMGLADACREVLKHESNMTARAVRDSLEVNGYNLKQHSNALASIHGVLKRLVESGEAEQLEAGGKTFYRGKSINPNRERAQAAMAKAKTAPYKPVEMVDEKGKLKPIIK